MLPSEVRLSRMYLRGEVRKLTMSTAGLAKNGLTPEQRQTISNTVSDAFSECIAADTDPELISEFITSWTGCYTSLPNCLLPTTQQRFVKALEAQLTNLQTREKKRASGEDVDEDDLVDFEDLENDEAVFESINNALKKVLATEGTAFPIQPIFPFLAFMSSPNSVSAHFGLRLACDLIEGLGDAAQQAVRPYLDRVHGFLTDAGEFIVPPTSVALHILTRGYSDPTSRRIAAYCVGVAAKTSAFADFTAASIEPLLSTIGPVDETSPLLMSARDNAVSACECSFAFSPRGLFVE